MNKWNIHERKYMWSRGLLEAWDMKHIGKHHSHVKLPSPSYHPQKVSHPPTWKLMKDLLHLRLLQIRWVAFLNLIDQIAYPMLSLSPLMISVELLLNLGSTNVNFMKKKGNLILKDPLSSSCLDHPI